MNRNVVAALCMLLAAGTSLGAPLVYENFNYSPGPHTAASLDWGGGWAGPFSGSDGPYHIAAASLSHPSAPPSTGGSLVSPGTPSNPFPPQSLTRPFASAFSPTDIVWMSFLARTNDLPSAATVRLGGATAPGAFFWTGGFGLQRGSQGIPAVRPWPDSFTPLHYFLVRFGPDAAGIRTLDLWYNPAPGPLGPSTLSTTGTAVPLNSLALDLGSLTSFDELRIDTSLSNVFVPAPGSAPLFAALAAFIRRRRA